MSWRDHDGPNKRISELEAEIERLRAALEQIAREQSHRTPTQAADYFQHVARAAIAKAKEGK